MSAETVASIVGTTFSILIDKLTTSNLIVHRGATVFYKSSEIEYNYHITIGSLTSRTGGIIKSIQSLWNKPIEFDEIIDIFGYGLPHNENLKEIGIIQNTDSKAIIDFGKMLKTIKSELVVLTIRKKLPEQLKFKLIVPHMAQTSRYVGDYTETDLEVVSDYANLWYKSFDQFTIREIEFQFTANVNLEFILEKIPAPQQKKIIKAAVAIISGNRDAIQYLKVMSDGFLTFQEEGKIQELTKTVSVEPNQYFKIKSITPRMQSCEISRVGYPMILPGSMRVVLECRLESKDIALRGTLRINLKNFGKILSDIIEDISKKSQHLSF